MSQSKNDRVSRAGSRPLTTLGVLALIIFLSACSDSVAPSPSEAAHSEALIPSE
jgi:hypothetical protein